MVRRYLDSDAEDDILAILPMDMSSTSPSSRRRAPAQNMRRRRERQRREHRRDRLRAWEGGKVGVEHLDIVKTVGCITFS